LPSRILCNCWNRASQFTQFSQVNHFRASDFSVECVVRVPCPELLPSGASLRQLGHSAAMVDLVPLAARVDAIDWRPGAGGIYALDRHNTWCVSLPASPRTQKSIGRGTCHFARQSPSSKHQPPTRHVPWVPPTCTALQRYPAVITAVRASEKKARIHFPGWKKWVHPSLLPRSHKACFFLHTARVLAGPHHTIQRTPTTLGLFYRSVSLI